MKCSNCEKLQAEIDDLKRRNAELAGVLGAPLTRNTDMIMGAALSGGDALALAKTLAENEAKKEANRASR